MADLTMDTNTTKIFSNQILEIHKYLNGQGFYTNIASCSIPALQSYITSHIVPTWPSFQIHRHFLSLIGFNYWLEIKDSSGQPVLTELGELALKNDFDQQKAALYLALTRMDDNNQVFILCVLLEWIEQNNNNNIDDALNANINTSTSTSSASKSKSKHKTIYKNMLEKAGLLNGKDLKLDRISIRSLINMYKSIQPIQPADRGKLNAGIFSISPIEEMFNYLNGKYE